MSQMLKSSGAMGVATMTSRVLGLVRDIFYTSFMGTTWVADAFNVAFMVPNLFRRLLGEGALTAAFIPIFKEKEKLGGEQEMWQAANAVISGLSASAAVVILLGMGGISVVLLLELRSGPALHLAGQLSRLFPYVLATSVAALLLKWREAGRRSAAPSRVVTLLVGLAAFASLLLTLGMLAASAGVLKQAGGGKTLLMLGLLRVMFPYVLLVCLAALFMGMLNARGHFFVPAMGATMLNIVMIASVRWLAPRLGAR